ncbi:cytochrome P450 [Streptomyces sp. NPDC093109]|uniref:cytochrome P450 n=1 Tax=Streptomyces sp. NPDC093109 TaxID=3154977 RepID=UPI00344B7512
MADVATFATAPGALPFIGHAARLVRPWPLLDSLPALGDVVELRLGSTRVHVVCSPELVHHVLTHDNVFDKGGAVYDQVRTVFGDDLVTCTHARHRRARRLVQPVFHHSRFPRYAELMAERATATVSGWRSGQILDVPAEMHTLIGRMSIAALFASRLTAQQLDQVYDDISTVTSGWLRRMVAPPALRGIAGGRAFDRARARFHATILDAIRRAETETETEKGAGTGPGAETKADDVAAVLLGARDEDGSRLGEQEIIDELVTMYFAAVETSAGLMSWTLDELARNPDIQDRVRAEIDDVLGDRVPTTEDVKQLRYTGRVLHEALRLQPPTWLLTREVTTDTTLGGHPLAKGATVAYSPYLQCRHPSVFPDPHRFDPDRWNDLNPAALRGTFVPFGGGARKCIGDTFGLTESAIALATLLRSWTVLPLTQRPPAWRTSLVLSPKALRVRLVASAPPAGIPGTPKGAAHLDHTDR